MSWCRTFEPTSDVNFLSAKLRELALLLAQDLASEKLCAKSIQLKYKTDLFKVHTKSKTINAYIHTFEDICLHGMSLLKKELPLSLRLMGLRMTALEDADAVRSKGLFKVNDINTKLHTSTLRKGLTVLLISQTKQILLLYLKIITMISLFPLE